VPYYSVAILMSQPIQIVWLKRDLRITDHVPISKAIENALPTLLIYVWEPSLMQAQDYSKRHWRFVAESLKDLSDQLEKFDIKVHQLRGELVEVLQYLNEKFDVKYLLSHEETGLKVTYDRDKMVKQFCIKSDIKWEEYQQFGVQRGRANRTDWAKEWYSFMEEAVESIPMEKIKTTEFEIPLEFAGERISNELLLDKHEMQKGGPRLAHRYLNSFLDTRHTAYNKNISKPEASRKSCSRLSPYLAFGNLSMREVYKSAKKAKANGNKSALNSFMSRLRWHCHFIQKFEMEDSYEFENLNRGYNAIRQEEDAHLYEAWENGQTGFPLVDACMRCVIATGYLNFRMRAMLVSFLSYHLWQPWRRGAVYLGKQFLDFEPGIHYPQFQMQSGVTGINTIRIYNPIKQASDHDAHAEFIKKWVPELRNLPAHFALQPWELTAMEESEYKFKKGVDYPQPIIDFEKAGKHARKEIWAMKKDPVVKQEVKRILRKHTTENRIV